MNQLLTAKLAMRNADLAYRFHAAEADTQEAEYWWARRCAWQRLVQQLEDKEKADCRGLCTRHFFN
jgi:hypothetical protein